MRDASRMVPRSAPLARVAASQKASKTKTVFSIRFLFAQGEKWSSRFIMRGLLWSRSQIAGASTARFSSIRNRSDATAPRLRCTFHSRCSEARIIGLPSDE